MKLHILKTLFFLVLVIHIKGFALDPRVKLNKISSENFDIIYDAKSYELAKIYLEEAERSHQILAEVFGISPEKTVVVLDDSYDTANGSAIGVPRPTVNIYTNVPTPLSSIDHFSNWPRDVFLHEYAHILNMEPARGGAKPLRSIFGSIIRPNMFLPRWHLEGLAVEMESRYNEFGRLKSTDYDSMIRALYLDSKWGMDNISAVNETSIPTWPTGQRPYFYGALIWHEMIQSKSISIVKTFNDRYGGRFPWVIGDPMRDEFGKTHQAFLEDVYRKYNDLAQKQILKIQEQGITKGDVIGTKNSVFNHSPEISPDGESLLFISENQDGDSLLYIFKRLGEQWVPLRTLNPTDVDVPQQEVEKTEIQRASWFPDSQKIVFDSVDVFNHHNYYYDLYTYDLKTKKTKMITKGLRAREPVVSPDGKTIAFIKAGGGKTAIYSVDSEGKNPALLYAPSGYERVSRPTFMNENEIVFSEKSSKGKDRLHILDLNTKKITKILDLQAKHPTITAQGIVFTSNKSGVENLYLTNKDLSSVTPLTNSLTRVVNGTIDPKTNKLIYSELTGDGPQIKQSPLTKNIKILPPIAHPIATDFPSDVKEAPSLEATPKSYYPVKYMFPQFWFPFVSFADEATIATVTIPGSDPTQRHSYVLNGEYHSKSEKFSTLFNYRWNNPLGVTTFSLVDYYKWYASLEETTQQQGVTAVHAFPFPGLSDDWSLVAGYNYRMMGLFQDFGSGPEKMNYYVHGPAAGVSYSNLEKKKLDISETGQKFTAIYNYNSASGRLSDYDSTYAELAHFHKKWLPSRHVLALKAQASVSERNRSILIGTQSNEVQYVLGAQLDRFITRGYPSGQFIGYTFAAGTVEYRFPIKDIWSGPNNTTPFFSKRIHGAVFAETLTVDGIYFNKNDSTTRANLGKYFTTAGAELKLDTTLFYHAPVTLKGIFAYGFESDAEGGPTVLVTIEAPQVF